VLEITSSILSQEYNVRTAADGREGLKEIERQMPDIILMDLAMPNLNGPDTLREIRKRWAGSIPIIVYTAYFDGELMKQAMEHSPFTLLAKPCLAAQILETARRLLRSSQTTVWHRRQRKTRPAS
jgi:CheY-like chemotaxis protein